MIYLLLSFFLWSDAVDHIDDGKLGPSANCILCGGRFLCGATDETLSIQYFNKKRTSSIRQFCYDKTLAYQKQSIEKMPWVSEELLSHQELQKIIRNIAVHKSKSKYTKNRIESIDENILRKRIAYRIQQGMPYKDILAVTTKEQQDKFQTQKTLLPVFSFENFRQQNLGNKQSYHQYLEHLIAAPRVDLEFKNKVYVVLNRDEEKSEKKYHLSKSDKKEKLPVDYFHRSGSETFIHKILQHPNAFCEKMNYRKSIGANLSSLVSLAEKYGGHSKMEQNYFFNDLQRSFTKVRRSNQSNCLANLEEFLNQRIVQLPDPAIIKLVENKVSKPNRRLPSSIPSQRPLKCRFNLDNYQEECE
tara:strand:- start:14990 stop:16066 length:1077 start_codon:yes stop_codon:yes gene_type:complete